VGARGAGFGAGAPPLRDVRRVPRPRRRPARAPRANGHDRHGPHRGRRMRAGARRRRDARLPQGSPCWRGWRRGRRENQRGGRPTAAMADPRPAGPVGVHAARRGVGVLPAGVPRHGLQRAWGLEAVRPLRGVQISASPSSLSLSALSVRPCFSTLLVQPIDIGLLVRYIVAIGLLAFVYTTLQLLWHGVRLTGGQDLEPKTGLLVDFAGDQVPLPAHSQHLCSEFCLLGVSCSIFLFPIAWNLFQSMSLGFRN
jgi:hypothetical protein